jgi:hypothetical protein
MKKALLVLIWLIACGDNLTRPSIIRDGAGQSATAAVVAVGTYTPAIEDDLVSWKLSGDGVVYLELHVRRGDELARIEIVARSATEPSLAIIDQVWNERLVLASTVEGSIRDGGLSAVHLDEPLVIGSSGETVWIKMSATGSPVQIYTLDWGPQL